MFDVLRRPQICSVMYESNVLHASRRQVNKICPGIVLAQLSMSSAFMHAFDKDLTLHFVLNYLLKLFVLHLVPAKAMNCLNFFLFV